MTDAADALRHFAADLHDKAFAHGLQYVLDPQPDHLAKIRELRDAAELLRWAAEGAAKPEYTLDNVV